MASGYKEGLAFFAKGDYTKAIECFENGTAFGGSAECLLMLGKCYENGLGIALDARLAKDYYRVALRHFEAWYKDSEQVTWLKKRIQEMESLPDLKEQRKYIDAVGWVIVKRGRVKEWTIKYFNEGTLVNIGPSIPFCRGFSVAEYHTKKENPNWTCDGNVRFYDGYALNTDFFCLTIRRGSTPSFESSINGKNCMVMFPCDADLNYLYVQEAIMNNVRDLLKKRAEVVFPQRLAEISKRVGVVCGKCLINTRLSNAWAQYNKRTKDVEFSLTAILLPEDNFESICIHELSHSFSSDHDEVFWSKFRQLAGQYLYKLDSTGHIHSKWPTLKI
jgi:hypothetical protein